MLARLTRIWNRYRDADQRQLPLFPDWERAQWLLPLPSVGAALGLIVLFAVGATWTTEPERIIARAEPVEEIEEVETPEYDLAAIPDSIKAAAERHRLPESLISAVIFVESGFDHAAVSSKGARGLMQLMPATSAMIGVSDPHNPEQNIDAGASHLRAMLDTFKGDLPLALAAYNAGEGNVVRYHGIPPYPETRRFVARVLRRMGDKPGAERVMAKPVPAPVWTSRTSRPGSGGPDGRLAALLVATDDGPVPGCARRARLPRRLPGRRGPAPDPELDVVPLGARRVARAGAHAPLRGIAVAAAVPRLPPASCATMAEPRPCRGRERSGHAIRGLLRAPAAAAVGRG